jgi:ATP-dependent Lhr-like helicase
VRPILDLQAKWSAIPTGEKLLIERVQTREGHHLFFYPIEGRVAHEGLAALFAYRLSRIQPITFTFSANDYGFELLSPDPIPLPYMMESNLFSSANLLDDILASLNASEMAKRQFREIARIAGLVFQRFPGGQMTAKQLQVSTGLIYDVLVKYDADNRLLEQAQREVLERQLEIERLQSALDRFLKKGCVVRDVARPTPFAFPLLVDTLRQTVSSEKLEDRVKRMQVMLEKAADRR